MARLIPLLAFITILLSCNEDENQFPSLFEINVVESGINYMVISWTESVDPRGGLIMMIPQSLGQV